MRSTAVLLCAFFMSVATVWAQTASGVATDAGAAAPPTGVPAASTAPARPDLTVPIDPAKKWVVGFSVFEAAGLSPENAYLAYSIPLLLRDELSGLDSHAYADDERELARKSIVAREISAVEKSITTLRQQRDSMFFGDTPPTAAALQAVDDRVSAAAGRRDFLRSLDQSLVALPSEKPIAFKDGTGSGKLLDLLQVPAAVYCARQGIDLLVGGSVQEVQGYLLVNIWVFDSVRDAMTRSAREAAHRDELYATVPSLGTELAGILLGRQWSVVAFTPNPPNGSLYVDDVLVASGASPALYLSPGIKEIRVSAPGYREEKSTMILTPGQGSPLAVTLSKNSAPSVFIVSEPAGAAVYVNSLWQGTTPLLQEKPPLRSRGVLSLAGFYDFPFSIGLESPPQLSFSLVPDLGARDAAQKKARDEFYASFGWFALSVPLPLFCSAFKIDNEAKQVFYTANSMPAEAAAAQLGAQAFLAGYVAGIALSVSLFTWMVTRIVHYISVSNGTAG
jgi:hypothetical protein